MMYWGNILGAVAERKDTAALWDDVKAAAAAENVSLYPASGADMSRLRGIAAEWRDKSGRIAAATDDLAVTSQHIARAPWSRSLTDQENAPRFELRYRATLLQEGELRTVWQTDPIDGPLPFATIGTMREWADNAAGETTMFGSQIGSEVVSTDSLILTAV